PLVCGLGRRQRHGRARIGRQFEANLGQPRPRAGLVRADRPGPAFPAPGIPSEEHLGALRRVTMKGPRPKTWRQAQVIAWAKREWTCQKSNGNGDLLMMAQAADGSHLPFLPFLDHAKADGWTGLGDAAGLGRRLRFGLILRQVGPRELWA